MVNPYAGFEWHRPGHWAWAALTIIAVPLSLTFLVTGAWLLLFPLWIFVIEEQPPEMVAARYFNRGERERERVERDKARRSAEDPDASITEDAARTAAKLRQLEARKRARETAAG